MHCPCSVRTVGAARGAMRALLTWVRGWGVGLGCGSAWLGCLPHLGPGWGVGLGLECRVRVRVRVSLVGSAPLLPRGDN